MDAELVVALVIEALDGGVLDSPVHSLDLAIGPRMPGLGRAVLDVIPGAGVFEGVSAEDLAISDCLLDQRHGRATGTGGGELDAIVRKHSVDLVGNGRDQPEQEVFRDGCGGLLVQLDEGELRGTVDSDEHVQLALLGPDLGNVDVEVADRVALEFPLRRFVALDIRKPTDAMALQAAMQ